MCSNITTWLKNIFGMPFGIYIRMPRPWRKVPTDVQLAHIWHSVGKDFYAALKRIEGEKHGNQTKHKSK